MSAVPIRSEPDILRKLAPGDAATCAALSRAVGWLHREQDWEMVIRLGDGIAIMRDGAMIATAISWSLGPSHAAFGMIIVALEFQGGGIGKRLMAQLLAQTEGRAQLLTATEAGRPLYEKVGFAAYGMVHQHHGVVTGTPEILPAAGEVLRGSGPADLETICRLDTAATGLERRPILSALLDLGDAAVLERDGEIIGFSIIRRFGRGEVIGPVVAPDAQGARRLIAHWLAQRQGEFVRIDFGDDELGGWVESFGLAEVDGGVAMARGAPPVPAGPSRRFALINQALG